MKIVHAVVALALVVASPPAFAQTLRVRGSIVKLGRPFGRAGC